MRIRILVSVAAVVAALIGCGSSEPTPAPSVTPTLPASPTPDLAKRPSSPVVISIVTPRDGETVAGSTVDVVIHVSGGTVLKDFSTHISPTTGHVHLLMDSSPVLMNYTLEQKIPITPGQTYTLRAEWVAADHFPFNPDDVTQPITFTAAP